MILSCPSVKIVRLDIIVPLVRAPMVLNQSSVQLVTTALKEIPRANHVRANLEVFQLKRDCPKISVPHVQKTRTIIYMDSSRVVRVARRRLQTRAAQNVLAKVPIEHSNTRTGHVSVKMDLFTIPLPKRTNHR